MSIVLNHLHTNAITLPDNFFMSRRVICPPVSTTKLTTSDYSARKTGFGQGDLSNYLIKANLQLANFI